MSVGDAPTNASLPLAILEPLKSLTELSRILVAVGGTRSAIELRQLVPISKLVFAGYSGSELVMGGRQLGHSGVPLARQMIENIGKWIESDLSSVANARVAIQPLSVSIDLELLDSSGFADVRATVIRIVDKFRATVRLIESDHSIEVVWSLACNSGQVIETLLKECPHESPLICCVARHLWMNDALALTQSHNGVTIGVEAESAGTVQCRLGSPAEFADFLTNVVQQLDKHD